MQNQFRFLSPAQLANSLPPCTRNLERLSSQGKEGKQYAALKKQSWERTSFLWHRGQLSCPPGIRKKDVPIQEGHRNQCPVLKKEVVAIFPVGFPVDFVRKLAGKITKGDHMIMVGLATHCKCEQIAKRLDCQKLRFQSCNHEGTAMTITWSTSWKCCYNCEWTLNESL